MKTLRFILATAIAAFLASDLVVAQGSGPPISIGVRLTVHSDALGEDRQILIYAPPTHQQAQAYANAGRPAERFPVIYLLDGDAHFHHTTGLVKYLSDLNRMPSAIVVAIPNTDRTRDLTPATSADDSGQFPTAGGADNFLRFLKDELIPFVDREYRTAPYRILIGHSFGGLFAVYALVEEPDLFKAHIAISPSLWWNDESLLSGAEVLFQEESDREGFLYMTMGDEGGNMIASAWGLTRILETQAPDQFQWEFQVFDKEDHGSVPHRSTYAALEAIFDGWGVQDPFQIAADGDLATIDAHYAALSERFGYEILTPEALINRLGYGLLQESPAAAVAAFEENVRRFPTSPNVYDSLGDAYDAAGRFQDARDSYAKAVELAARENHPNLGVYRANLARMEAKLGQGGR